MGKALYVPIEVEVLLNVVADDPVVDKVPETVPEAEPVG